MVAIALFVLGTISSAKQSSVSDLVAEARTQESAKNWKAAAAIWDQLTVSNPTRAGYWLGAGNDLYSAKEYAKAIPYMEKADELGVSYKWDMRYSIACCYALSGDKERALTELGKAIDLGYRDLDTVRKDPDLLSLHDNKRFETLAATADVSKMDRVEGYRYDLWLLNRELRRMHYSPYLRHSKDEIDHFVDQLKENIPNLTDAQIAVKFKELAAMMGDGHTHIGTSFERPGGKQGIPVSFMTFTDGTFVISADAGHVPLIGSQVLKINGRALGDVLEAVKPICSYDNSMWILAQEPRFLRIPGLLLGLGLAPKADEESLTLRGSTGAVSEVTLKADSDQGDDWKFARQLGANPAPLTFAHRDKNYWFDQVPNSAVVFAQYNAVQDDPTESIAQFSARLFKYIEDHAVEKLILDIRWNGGGNNFLNKPLLEGLIKSKLNQTGKLFVIVGRNTFSAAMCFATQVERYTNAIFAGEPTGSSPNFIGESIPINLPYSHMHGSVSDLYWQNSVAMDHRTWISPTIYMPPKFADYAANQDPVIDAILAYHAEEK